MRRAKAKDDGRARLERMRNKLMADFDDFPSAAPGGLRGASERSAIVLTKPKARKGKKAKPALPASLMSLTSPTESKYSLPADQAEPQKPWATCCVCFGSACEPCMPD